MTDANRHDENGAAIEKAAKKAEAKITVMRPEKTIAKGAAKRATNLIQETVAKEVGIDPTRGKTVIVLRMEPQEIEIENDLMTGAEIPLVADRETDRQIAQWKSPNSTIEMAVEAHGAAEQTATTGPSLRKFQLSLFD